jgi:hypothetical protein
MNTRSPRPSTTFQQSTVARAPSKPSRVSSKASWLCGNGHKGIDGDEAFEHREPRPSLRLRQPEPEPDPDLTRTDHLAPDCHIDGVPPALFGSGLSAAIQSAMQVTCVLRLPRQRNSTIQRRSRADLITHLRFHALFPSVHGCGVRACFADWSGTFMLERNRGCRKVWQPRRGHQGYDVEYRADTEDTLNQPIALPLSSHGKPIDSFAQARDLENELKRTLRGEVRFDRGSRALYATDGSNYRQIPIGLVVPRDREDVVRAVAVCRNYGAPVLARGAGTSLAGQCCNVAVILDFTKYMNQILEIDPQNRCARVQPGVVLDSLRKRAEMHELTFAPDPSTHSRCTIGGMIGNNSCGTHSLLGGKTVDNVEELRVLLYDGSEMTVGATPDRELELIIGQGGRRGDL